MTHRIKEPILLDREPRVSFRYEYKSVLVSVPYFIEDRQPDIINFKLSHRADPSLTLIEQDFPAGASLQLLVPRGILNPDPMGNLAVIKPLGGDFETRKILFSYEELPVINLSQVLIREHPFVVTGTVLQRANNQPVTGARLALVARTQNTVYGNTQTDSTGFFRFELKNRFGTAADYYLRVETDFQYPNRLVPVSFDAERQFDTEILLGVSQAGANGVAYRVMENGTPFRQGPENGAEIQFFLAAGDIITVIKVAGNRLYGFVEMVTSNESEVQPVYGWIQDRDVELSE